MASTKLNSPLTTIYKSPKRYINHKSQNQIKLISNSLNPKPNTTQLPTNLYSVCFKTIGTGKLGISIYPDFEYSPRGGFGTGTAIKISEEEEEEEEENRASNSELSVCFDVSTLYIPSLTNQTTKFLGLPLPPFLKIDIFPEIFQGVINPESGKVELEFTARFCFTAGGGIYKAPALLVKTVLTTEESKGESKRGKGERMDGEGKCRLVGVAKVETIDDWFMNTFLSLPAECLADLQAVISVSDDQV